MVEDAVVVDDDDDDVSPYIYLTCYAPARATFYSNRGGHNGMETRGNRGILTDDRFPWTDDA